MDEYDIIGDDYDDDEEGSVGSTEYDIVGDDDDEDDDDLLDALEVDVSGLGNTEIVGVGARRRPRLRKRRRRSRRSAIRKILNRAGAVIEKNPLTRRRRYLLGFSPTVVAASGSVIIPAAPQNLFRAERLVIPSDIAFDLGIQNIVVGTQNQFAQAVEVPAAVFSEVAIDTHVVFDTAEVGNQIALDVRNKTGASVEFTAAMLGTLAK